MIDPPHEQVKEAIATALNAGMKVMMITDDNEITVRAIANLIGNIPILNEYLHTGPLNMIDYYM